MTFLTILGVTEILCSFRLVLEGKTGKEIPESSRFRVLRKVFSKQFCFMRCRRQYPGPLNRGGIADLSLLGTLWQLKKNNFMAPFYGWGSTASRLEPFRGGSLLFTTKFPEIPGTHFINLGRMKG